MDVVQSCIRTLERELHVLKGQEKKWRMKEKKLLEELKKVQDKNKCLEEQNRTLNCDADTFATEIEVAMDRLRSATHDFQQARLA